MALREELEHQGNWLFRWRSYLPLLVLPVLLVALRDSEHLESVLGDATSDILQATCVAISLLGLIIRCIAIGYAPKGTSGRNTSRQIAETLNTTGMYSVVRHPLYLGNFVIILGITLFVQVWWFSVIAVLAFSLYYERIMFAEEEFLRGKFAEPYLKWAAITPAFWPGFRRWRQPEAAFSFRNVLKREYSGFFAIVASFTVLEVLGDVVSEGTLELDLFWATFFLVGLVVYLALRTLKKKTSILVVDGR